MKTLDMTRIREIFDQRLINRFAKGGEMMKTPPNPVLNPVDWPVAEGIHSDSDQHGYVSSELRDLRTNLKEKTSAKRVFTPPSREVVSKQMFNLMAVETFRSCLTDGWMDGWSLSRRTWVTPRTW